MKPYFIKTSSLLKFIFRNWVWSYASKKNVLYLTFDDGPTPEITEWTLNELAKYKAKATFFCIGKNIGEHPEIFQKIIEEKHTVGNHTNNHLNGWKTKTEIYLENIEESEKYFTQYLKLKTKNLKLFRPPYGKITLSQSRKIRKKGYKIIMWDVLSADFDTTISNENCLENVIRNIQNGSIIVFHDSVKASEKLKFVLPKVLEYYSYHGFIFKSIDY
ncbi:MAG: polysaccharide deacetylase family protein [Bacteroidetes bacterium HGW-Bacteroidetes-3]|jgi:peptidoglycan/xylan/chitin deacetylase (PgdA/CDA1 family)|nr:MAG: polysaccharide deacetylase family protein [Bacteroidetes bacterium HGW-Bacteroidetes-3]